MQSEAERIARLEEQTEQQKGINQAVCGTLDEIKKHLHKMELIALGALILFGAEKAATVLQALPGVLP